MLTTTTLTVICPTYPKLSRSPAPRKSAPVARCYFGALLEWHLGANSGDSRPGRERRNGGQRQDEPRKARRGEPGAQIFLRGIEIHASVVAQSYDLAGPYVGSARVSLGPNSAVRANPFLRPLSPPTTDINIDKLNFAILTSA